MPTGLPILAPVPRPPGMGTPCATCPKQPDDVPPHERTPQTAKELGERGYAVLGHYLRCRAVGRFPHDALVERHAAVCDAVYRAHQDAPVITLLSQLVQLFAVLARLPR